MTRLNQENRKAIATALLTYRFKDQANALRDRHAELAKYLYELTYDDKKLKLMHNAPVGAFEKVNTIAFSMNGSWKRVDFAGLGSSYSYPYVKYADKKDDVFRPVFAKHQKGATFAFDNSNDFVKTFQSFELDASRLNDEINKAKKEVDSTLARFSSVKTLIEAWPEIAPFAKPYLKAPEPRSLPVVQTATLNETFKLPVPEVEPTA